MNPLCSSIQYDIRLWTHIHKLVTYTRALILLNSVISSCYSIFIYKNWIQKTCESVSYWIFTPVSFIIIEVFLHAETLLMQHALLLLFITM
jgi:hypothetical protein